MSERMSGERLADLRERWSWADLDNYEVTDIFVELDRARAREKELSKCLSQQNEEISQTLGRALGYPRFCDDPKNFPDCTDEDGFCVGDHVAETLAMEAARRIGTLIARERDLLEALKPFTAAMVHYADLDSDDLQVQAFFTDTGEGDFTVGDLRRAVRVCAAEEATK